MEIKKDLMSTNKWKETALRRQHLGSQQGLIWPLIFPELFPAAPVHHPLSHELCQHPWRKRGIRITCQLTFLHLNPLIKKTVSFLHMTKLTQLSAAVHQQIKLR